MKELSELQKLSLHVSDCLTFTEASKIIFPLLAGTDFMSFMESNYLKGGVPNKYYMQKKMFKVVKVAGDTDMSHCISIFITKVGMGIIVQKVLRHYHKMHIFLN